MKAATRTETQESAPVERLAPEDLAALRRWITDREVASADDAVTVNDIAEATGLSAADVQTQLDRIREARALQPVAAPPRLNQKLLLALALALFAGAGAVWALTPRKLTDEEFEAKMQDILREKVRNRKPRPIKYPIESDFKTSVTLPAFFKWDFVGDLTTTHVSSTVGKPMVREQAIAAIAQAARAGFDAAYAAENKAPVPTAPLAKPKENPMMFGYQRKPGTFALMPAGGGVLTSFSLKPKPGQSAADFDKEVQGQIDAFAKGVVDDALRSQDMSLHQKRSFKRYSSLPTPGFSLTYKGRQTNTGTSDPLIMLPVDTGLLAKQLEDSIRGFLWQDSMPSDFSTSAPFRAMEAKKPRSPFVEIEIKGPSKTITLRLPVTASDEYPTAADAARATDKILKDGVRKAVEQIEKLQKEVRPR